MTEELVRREHEVVLFARGDSTTAAELVACCSWDFSKIGECEIDGVTGIELGTVSDQN